MTTAVTVDQLHNLTNRAAHGLTLDEQQRLRDGIDHLHAERDAARATNRRLNLRAQQLESELAAYRRAVDQWEINERGTYVPLRTLAAIAKAAGLPVPERWELHYQRVGQAEAALTVVTAKATEWAALAPADDWGNTPQDTALADAGRYLLKLMADATKETP